MKPDSWLHKVFFSTAESSGYRILTRNLLVVAFLFASFGIMGQSTKSFREVDSVTYQLYLKGDWNDLVTQSKMALEAGHDYFYLRMRLAYALFNLKQYRAAIPHYQKALAFNTADPYAQEYLLRAYEYGGRQEDALKFSGRLKPEPLSGLYRQYQAGVTAVGLLYTFNNGNSGSMSQSIADGISTATDGYQKVTNFFHSPNFYLSHRLGRSMLVNHQVGSLIKNEFSYAVQNGTAYPSPDQTMFQFSYGVSLPWTPAFGWRVIPAFTLVNAKIPLYAVTDYGMGSGRNRQVYDYLIQKDAFYSLRLQKELRFGSLGISYSSGQVNLMEQTQSGLHLTIYPLSNLNLYYAFDGYLHQEMDGQQSVRQFIHKHLLGFRVSSSVWMEASAMMPEVRNFYDLSANLLYNSMEYVRNEFSLRSIFLIRNSKARLMARFGYYEAESGFIPDATPLNQSNNHSYSNINFSGGIVWKL